MKLTNHLPGKIKYWLNKFYYSIFQRERVPRETIHEYWKKPTDEGKNKLDMYKNNFKSDMRASLIVEKVKQYSFPDDKFLELGCNTGLNLLKLDSMFTTGVDINKEAIEQIQRVSLDIHPHWNLHTMSIEDFLKASEDNSYDVIFTKNVLEHCHYESDKIIFKEMVRVTEKYIIILEDEIGNGWRHFPRDYKKIFEELGMKEVEATNLKHYWGDDVGFKFWLRVFEKEVKQ